MKYLLLSIWLADHESKKLVFSNEEKSIVDVKKKKDSLKIKS